MTTDHHNNMPATGDTDDNVNNNGTDGDTEGYSNKANMNKTKVGNGGNITRHMKRLLGGVTLTKLNFLLWGVVVLVIAVACMRLCHTAKNTEVSIKVDDKIDPTPTIITAMKEIGEWEFLAITDEEMVDTVRRGFLRDEKLVRIYYGKLSLGINMHKADPKWIVSHGDSVVVTLPPVELLDNDFIDETRTRAFIETGSWTDADRQTLYDKAHKMMKTRCLTPANISNAKQNAEEQFGKMLRAMGIDKYSIKWQ